MNHGGIEVITNLSSSKPLRPLEGRPFYLASDIVAGPGVFGFLIVDRKPMGRAMSYTDGEYAFVVRTTTPDFILPDWRQFPSDDPTRRSHYVGTERGGFKLIRYHVLLPKVQTFFDSYRYLGDSMIDMCCREGTFPEELDEEPANPTFLFDSNDQRVLTESLVAELVQRANPEVQKGEEQRMSLHHVSQIYVSFHRNEFYHDIIAQGKQALLRTIYNFNQVLESPSGSFSIPPPKKR